MLSPNLQFVTDESGQKTAVLVSIDQWNEVFAFYQEYHSIKSSIRRGLKEIMEMSEEEKKGQDLNAFLDEL